MNTTMIDTFLKSTNWDRLVKEATGENGEEAMRLVELIDLHLESLIFFMKLKEHNRSQREIDMLTRMFNMINTLYNNET